MKFTDIIALAKAGYTPADIKDLLALDSHEPVQTPEEKNEPDDQEGTQPEDAEPNTPRDSDTDESTRFYEEQINKLKKNIEELQKANVNKPLPEQKTDEDIFYEAYRKLI